MNLRRWKQPLPFCKRTPWPQIFILLVVPMTRLWKDITASGGLGGTQWWLTRDDRILANILAPWWCQGTQHLNNKIGPISEIIWQLWNSPRSMERTFSWGWSSFAREASRNNIGIIAINVILSLLRGSFGRKKLGICLLGI